MKFLFKVDEAGWFYMPEDKGRDYPVSSLHDFLFELDREWDKFRLGSLIGVFATVVLLAFVFRAIVANLRFILAPHRVLPLGLVLDVLLPIAAAIAVAYSGYSLYRQYRFFQKWERRLDLLQHLERQLIGEE